jgi:hypothetical protein
MNGIGRHHIQCDCNEKPIRKEMTWVSGRSGETCAPAHNMATALRTTCRRFEACKPPPADLKRGLVILIGETGDRGKSVLLVSDDALALAEVGRALSSVGDVSVSFAMAAADLPAALRPGRFDLVIVDSRVLIERPGSELNLAGGGAAVRLVGGRFAAGALATLESEGIYLGKPRLLRRARLSLRGAFEITTKAARRVLGAVRRRGPKRLESFSAALT